MLFYKLYIFFYGCDISYTEHGRPPLRSAEEHALGALSVPTRPPWPSGAGHRRRGRTGGARVHEHVLPGAAEELGVDLEGGHPRAGVRVVKLKAFIFYTNHFF